MFGKRNSPAAPPAPSPKNAEAPARAEDTPEDEPLGELPIQRRLFGTRYRPPPKVSAERKPVERARSEEYYDVKTTVFNALIDSIDDVRQASIAAGLKRPGAEQP